MRKRMTGVLGAALLIAVASAAAAQQPSATTSTEMGKPVTTTSTRHISGKIVSVDGNKVVVQGNEGTREYNVPEGFKFQADGKEIGVADLKPGMSVSAAVTTTTTSTPVTVTQIRKGKVLTVSGQTVIVRGPDGIRRFNQEDLDKRHVKLKNAEGKDIELHQLKAGDVFTAVIVTDEPPKVVSEREAKAMVQGAPAAAPQAAAAPPPPAPAPAAAPAPAPAKKLPKTASLVPLVGAAGAMTLLAALALTLARRARHSS
jgi:hypothetical protein